MELIAILFAVAIGGALVGGGVILAMVMQRQQHEQAQDERDAWQPPARQQNAVTYAPFILVNFDTPAQTNAPPRAGVQVEYARLLADVQDAIVWQER